MAAPDGATTLRPTVAAYVTWLALPCAFLTAGWLLRDRPIFDVGGVIVLIVAPLVAIGLTFWTLSQARIEVGPAVIALRRFRLAPWGLEALGVPISSISFGVLANRWSVRRALMSRSKSSAMPVSVLYLEYETADGRKIVAFNVANFDNRLVLQALAPYVQIDVSRYGVLPGP